MTADAPVPDILLERHRLGELASDDARNVAERLRHDGALRARLDALDRSDRELREAGTLDVLRSAVSRRIGAAAGSRVAPARRWAPWMLAAGAAATIALGYLSQPPRSMVEDGDRIKGLRPGLTVYRRTADGSETLADGAAARHGDLLRVGYRPAGRAYGLIFSIDGRQTVTMHLPAQGDRAAPLARESTVLLDRAYELDDAPLWERFYFVAGDYPFDAAPIIAAARRAPAAPLRLPRGLEQATFSLQKEARP